MNKGINHRGKFSTAIFVLFFTLFSLFSPLTTLNTYATPNNSNNSSNSSENSSSETTDSESNDSDETDSEKTQTENQNQNQTNTSNNPEGTTNSENPDSEKQNELSCSEQIGILSFIVCPTTGLLAKGIDALYSTIENFLVIKPITTDNKSPIYIIWSYVRNIANIIFIIFLLLIVYSQVTGLGFSNYNIKKMLPKLIIAAILVNFSYLICQVLVDVSNIIGNALKSFLEGIATTAIQNQHPEAKLDEPLNIYDIFLAIAGGTSLTILGGVGIATAVAASGGLLSILFTLIPIVFAGFIAVVVGLITISLRQAVVILLTITSPIIFALYVLPNTHKYYLKWKSIFAQMLVFFPAFSFLFGVSKVLGYLFIFSSETPFGVIIGIAVQVLPIMFAIKMLNMSKSVLGSVNQALSGISGKLNNTVSKEFSAAANLARANYQKRALEGKGGALRPDMTISRIAMQNQAFRAHRQKRAEEDQGLLIDEQILARQNNTPIIGYHKNGKPIYSKADPIKKNSEMLDEYRHRELKYRTENANKRVENFMSNMGDYIDKYNYQNRELKDLAKRQTQNFLEQKTVDHESHNNDVASDKFYLNKMKEINEKYIDSHSENSAKRFNLTEAEIAKNDKEYQKYIVRAAGTSAWDYDPALNIKNPKHVIDAIDSVLGDISVDYDREYQASLNRRTTYYSRIHSGVLNNDFKKAINDADFERVIATMRVMATRGDYDKVLEGITDLSDNGKIIAGTENANVLFKELMAFKDADPVLGRFGKFGNIETAAWSTGKRQDNRITFEQFATGKLKDLDGEEKTTKFNLAQALKGTSLVKAERTVFGEINSVSQKYGVDLFDATLSNVSSAALNFQSGGDQMYSLINMITGLDAADWNNADTRDEKVLELTQDPKKSSILETGLKKATTFLSKQKAANIISMKSDVFNGIMQLFTAKSFKDLTADESEIPTDPIEKQKYYEEKLAEAKNAAKEIFVKQIESSDARNVILSSQKSGAIAQMDNNVRALVFSDEHGNLAEKIKTMKNSEEGRLEQDAKKYNHKKSSK